MNMLKAMNAFIEKHEGTPGAVDSMCMAFGYDNDSDVLAAQAIVYKSELTDHWIRNIR